MFEREVMSEPGLNSWRERSLLFTGHSYFSSVEPPTSLRRFLFAAANTCSGFKKERMYMSGQIQVPTAITGVVSKLPDLGFCMDGATHLIHSFSGATRLKGRSKQVTEALNFAAETSKKVTVMGYPVVGPECTYLSAYSVSEAEIIVQLMEGDNWPWKTLNLK